MMYDRESVDCENDRLRGVLREARSDRDLWAKSAEVQQNIAYELELDNACLQEQIRALMAANRMVCEERDEFAAILGAVYEAVLPAPNWTRGFQAGE